MTEEEPQLRAVAPIGEALVAAGVVSSDDVDSALAEQRVTRERLGDILVRRGAVSSADFVRILAQQFGIRFIDLADYVPDPAAGRLIPEHFARRFQAVGLFFELGKLVVAMANPADVFALDDIRTLTGRDIMPAMAVPDQVDAAIDRLFRAGFRADDELVAAATEFNLSVVDNGDGEKDEEDEGPVVRFVHEIIARAVNEGASDLHVEPTRGELRIRFRVDGVLRDIMAVPRPLQPRIASRIKIMAEMDIADRRAPQDGRATMVIDGRRVDIRVVSFPTTNGEAVVLRLLDKTGMVLDIGKLGFRPEVLDRYQECCRQSTGAILVTGPTGSGKSTTLYATLQEISGPERNIITIEDPVEYELDGIKQVQIENKAGVSFASALRSLLRADPDIIMVGEVRDQDTARLAIDAALTGHLVLTSLHTKSAAATPARLVKMGIEPFLVTSSLQCTLAQRLARRLCDRCKQAAKPAAADLARLGWTEADAESVGELGTTGFFRAVGCSYCKGAGYIGRFALHEVMPITEAVADAICAFAPPSVVEALAMDDGMVPLRRDGLRKAAAGLTTLEELQRVVG
ncbi:MAG TPA: GspE/PulE family protein [Acidimicrobiales bacterium]|jgi:type IV pilus assembly protein PilB|nr:GspE/PulE family protein [Acidimicrobiales bacterium]